MKLLKRFFLLLFIPIVFSSFTFHDYYFSLTEIEFVEDQKSVQIITKIFTDDIEKLLQERYDDTIVLDAGNDESNIDLFIIKYLSEKIKIKINDRDYNFKFIGKEYDEFSVYCYMEIDDVDKIEQIKVTNAVLQDQFEKQENLVKVSAYGQNKSINLIINNPTGVFKFDKIN